MRLIIAAILVLLSTATLRAEGFGFTVQLTLNGQVIEGTPLHKTDKLVHLLGRDGKLWQFAPEDAKDFRKTSDQFESYSHSEFRGALLREFGKEFDVTGTGHYLVVHPAGQRDKWAARFEELYRSFMHYFSVRGLQPTAPKFPLVAVVLRSQVDFMRLAVKDGVPPNAGVLGYYSPLSNRILLFDSSVGGGVSSLGGAGRDDKQEKQDWQKNNEVIIHEAAHQTAFNTGLHSRYALPPRWVAEGMGTLFEARGVWNSHDYKKVSDRINAGRLSSFRKLAKNRPAGTLSELLSSDRLFETNIERAYAEAWAFTFFLSETEPRKYWEYLAKTAGHTPFAPVSSIDRLKDFTDIFGTNLGSWETRYLRFLGDVK